VRPVDPPLGVCRSVIAAAPWDALPTLSGIIEAPTILPDGSMIQTPGYDPVTGLLFDPGNTQFPQIPSEPSRAQAEAALRTVAAPFKDFPFVDEPSRSVALAAVLSALVRRGLRAAPLTAFDAPKMASGKSLIATVCSYVATGRGPYLMSQVADPTDERKRLLSALLENPAVIVIDNVEHPVRSDSLCIALTEGSFTDRLLGQSRTATVATNCCFFVTGNNVIIAGDLSARALVCRIDPACERPEERTFALNLHEWVPAHRGELAAAALTIIKAYLAAGEPRQAVPNFARFEDWQRLCRFPLTWLGLADPCETRRRIEASDPVRETLRALLSAWHRQFSDNRVTIKAAIEAGAKASDLQAAMEAVAGERGGINARRLGRFMAKHERRIEGGLRFVRDGEQDRALFWRAVGNEFPEFPEFFSSPSREQNSGNVNGKAEFSKSERWERNSGNSSNSSRPDPIEVDL
jgi:putative DNA primase/helicase